MFFYITLTVLLLIIGLELAEIVKARGHKQQSPIEFVVNIIISLIILIISWTFHFGVFSLVGDAGFSFEAFLSLAVLMTGAIWLADRVFFATKRREQGGKESVLVEYSRSFFPVLFAVLFIRSFIVEPFRIPSSSMLPTLHIGDFLLVNKFDYGLRLPVLHTKIFDIGEPKRGDVMVFRWPKNPKMDFIKRVIGLPGDTVSYYNKTLSINGKPIAQEVRKKDAETAEVTHDYSELRFEHLGKNGHNILIMPPYPDVKEGEWKIPKGQYFVMGDNRDNSDDSRYWGTVPEKNIVGKAFFIWMSWDWKNSEMGVVWHRIGTLIE